MNCVSNFYTKSSICGHLSKFCCCLHEFFYTYEYSILMHGPLRSLKVFATAPILDVISRALVLPRQIPFTASFKSKPKMKFPRLALNSPFRKQTRALMISHSRSLFSLLFGMAMHQEIFCTRFFNNNNWYVPCSLCNVTP